MSVSVLVLYDRKGPAIENLAAAIASGVDAISDAHAELKLLDSATTDDLLNADALILGSPNWSGITGSMKSWLDEQGDLWEEGSLAGKPGATFTTGWGRHSGLEFTLLQQIHWMLACGMIIVGLPWSSRMRVSGSYYGATAVGEVSEADLAQAAILGSRVATIALRLKSS